MSSPTQVEAACRQNARFLAEFIAFYMPVMSSLAQAAQDRLQYTPKHALRLAENSLPFLARAGRRLRYADELVSQVGEVPPENDPRLASPLIRMMAESLLAALTARSSEELKRLPLLSTNRLMVESARPELRAWTARHTPLPRKTSGR